MYLLSGMPGKRRLASTHIVTFSLLRPRHKERRQCALLLIVCSAANASSSLFQVLEVDGAVDSLDMQLELQRLVLVCSRTVYGNGAFEEAGVIPERRGYERDGGTGIGVDSDAASADAGAELAVEDAEDDAVRDDGARRRLVGLGAEERQQMPIKKGVDPRLHRLGRLRIRRTAARVAKLEALVAPKVLFTQLGELDDGNVPRADALLLGRNGVGRLHGALQVRRADELYRNRPFSKVRGQAVDLQHAVRRQPRVAQSGVDARHVVDRLAMADQEEEHLSWARTSNEQRWSELRVMEAKTVLRVPCGRKAQADCKLCEMGGHGGRMDWEEKREGRGRKVFLS